MNEQKRGYRQFNNERIISILDLMEEFLRKIWLIIILAVVCAILFAGYKYMSDRSKEDTTTNTESYEKAESSLTEEEKGEVRSVLMMYDEESAQEEYMRNSVLMNIDPYHEDRVTIQFLLQTEDGSLTNALQAVDNYITGGTLVKDLLEFYPEEDSAYLSELISFEQRNVASEQPEENEEAIVNPISVFWVQVIHSNPDDAEQLADAAIQCIDSYGQELEGYFGTCKITFLDQSIAQVYDSDLKNTQNTVVSDQITLQNRIDTQLESLSDDQIKVLEASLAEGTDSEGNVVTESSTDLASGTATTVRINKRYVAIGVIVGIVLGIIVIALYYVFRGTLNVAQEMPGIFGISVFGQVHMKKQRNPLVRGWRRLTSKKKAPPIETEQQIALTNLKNFCENRQVERLLLTGSREELSENAWLREVQEELKKEQIDAEIAGGLPLSPAVIEEMNTYTYVVLVETLHSSVYTEVVREVEICAEHNVQVIGSILFS